MIRTLPLVVLIAITLMLFFAVLYQKQVHRKEMLKLKEDNRNLQKLKDEEVNKRLQQQMEAVKVILMSSIKQERGIVKDFDPEFFSQMKILFFGNRTPFFNWEKFYQMIDEMHHDALTQMFKNYPQLPVGQLRFCSLLLAKFSNKDIAFICNIYPNSIRMKRSTIKHILQLPRQEDLVDFIIANADKKSE
jgi:hypothetical protein